MAADAADVVVVGAGAAGLATAIFVARRAPHARVVVIDGARRLGAKILISGGGRCNITNRDVSSADYWGGDRRVIASVLRAFPASRTVSFFEEIGVPLHEEERGKLFPDSNQARSVLDALLGELAGRKVEVRAGEAAKDVRPGASWLVVTTSGTLSARHVVLATGGLSVPRTGSDGHGLSMAASLGHTLVPTTPALAPLIVRGDFHGALSGVSHEAALAVLADGRAVIRLRGPLLWTHFGVSGPLALDASRHWLRVELEGRAPSARLSFVPGLDFSVVDRALLGTARGSDAPAPCGSTPLRASAAVAGAPRTLRGQLAGWLPTAVADALLESLALDGGLRLAHLEREDRRRVAHALTDFELPIAGSRGYNYAEATAGGVSLGEVDRRTMESTRHPGLYLVGEMLDVDGRLGGFNFQWAWSSAWVAAEGIGKVLAR